MEVPSTLHRCSKCDASKPPAEFPPSKATKPGQWCRDCLRIDQRRIKGLAAHSHAVTCRQCSAPFVSTYVKAAYCSKACKVAGVNDARQAAINAAKPDRNCTWCGASIGKERRADAKFCSADCNEQAHRRTRAYRRRSGERVRPRKQPLVNLAHLAERDGYLCGICAAPVDLSLKHPDPMAVTVDHIIPLSRGGAALDPANCRVAHHVCNVTRGARGV